MSRSSGGHDWRARARMAACTRDWQMDDDVAVAFEQPTVPMQWRIWRAMNTPCTTFTNTHGRPPQISLCGGSSRQLNEKETHSGWLFGVPASIIGGGARVSCMPCSGARTACMTRTHTATAAAVGWRTFNRVGPEPVSA